MAEESPKIPGGAYSEKIYARFWLSVNQKGYLGIGRVELLEHIQRCGSMNQAAKEMGMSYKKAWKLIDELNEMFEQPLVTKVQGGKSGGGSVLTERGVQVVANFRLFEQRFAEFLQAQSALIEI